MSTVSSNANYFSSTSAYRSSGSQATQDAKTADQQQECDTTAQDAYKDTYESLADKPTGVRGFADDFIVRNSALSPEAQENLKTQMADIVAIHRFEQANNFSFNSDPSTPEEKQNYNEMLRRLISEGNVKGSPLYGF
ncbi:MAG: hypothetical protein ACRC46_12610, partial [Thermoguttaceae bacterium]